MMTFLRKIGKNQTEGPFPVFRHIRPAIGLLLAAIHASGVHAREGYPQAPFARSEPEIPSARAYIASGSFGDSAGEHKISVLPQFAAERLKYPYIMPPASGPGSGQPPRSGLSAGDGNSTEEEPLFEMEEDVEVLAAEEKAPALRETGGHGWGGRSWAEVHYGPRIDSHTVQGHASVRKELRARYENEKTFRGVEGRIRVEGVLDGVTGRAEIDARELSARIPTPGWMTATMGRQIIKWGTGDRIFVNDLFPKDYVALYSGRNLEYMKAPCDALELGFYNRLGTLDVVYMPRFTPYRIPTGKRLAYYSPTKRKIVGEEHILPMDKPDKYFREDALAVRYSRKIGNTELALYGTDGYWPVPNAINAGTRQFYHSRLRTFGLGLRGGAFRGIWTTEAAYYDSLEDKNGADPLVPNSQIRGFIGYERELVKNLDLGMQYYAEQRRDQAAYEKALSYQGTEPRKYELITSRLSYRMLKQTLNLSVFTFYSPTDDDYYVRADLTYKPSDDWTLYAGSGHFGGDQASTDFAQYKQNSNVFLGARYYW